MNSRNSKSRINAGGGEYVLRGLGAGSHTQIPAGDKAAKTIRSGGETITEGMSVENIAKPNKVFQDLTKTVDQLNVMTKLFVPTETKNQTAYGDQVKVMQDLIADWNRYLVPTSCPGCLERRLTRRRGADDRPGRSVSAAGAAEA